MKASSSSGAGADRLIGGLGDDTFAFLTTGDSNPAATDVIADFTKGADRIDVSGIDPISGGKDDLFLWAGTTGTARGIWYVIDAANTVTHVYADTDGNAATHELQIDLVGTVTLAAGDFVL